jgi:hypothetical protein
MDVRKNDWVGQKRDFNMKNALCFPLGPLQWSLAAPGGSICKTNFGSKHQEKCTYTLRHTDRWNGPCPLGYQPTFDGVADRILSMAISEGSMTTRIDVVFDS